MKRENLLLKSALALAIVDLILIVAILLQVNNLVKDVVEVQNKQLEIGVMRERLEKAEKARAEEEKAKETEKQETKIEDSLTIDPETGWQVYRNEELRIELKVPKEYTVRLDTELKGLDQGKLRNIYIFQPYEPGKSQFRMSIWALSEDFRIGVGEGCCFYYADDPINLNLSDAELLKILNNNFAKNIENAIFDVKRHNLNGREVLRFFKTDAYGSIWAHDAILLPYNVSGFTNILIISPPLVTVPRKGGESEEQRKQTIQTIINSIRNSEYLKDENVAKEYTIFKQILSTLKFK